MEMKMSTPINEGMIVRNPDLDYGDVGRPDVQYELYNGGPEVREFSFDSKPYKIPGRDQKWKGRHPYTGDVIEWPMPGTLPLWDPPNQPYRAKDIVDFALGKDRRSSNVVALAGVRVL